MIQRRHQFAGGPPELVTAAPALRVNATVGLHVLVVPLLDRHASLTGLAAVH